MHASDDRDPKRPTGFASPADYVESSLNLHQLVVTHPEATFFWEAQGDGMRDAGIASGDILIVDRSEDARHDDVVVVAVQGDYLVRRWRRAPDGIVLIAEHPDYAPLLLAGEVEYRIWGVVIAVLHYPNRKRR